MKKVKVLILDDSLFVREILQHELERDINIQVVAKAAHAFEARDKIIEFRPDILISDVIMEKMNGLDFVKQLLPQYYLTVIMISSDHSIKEEAEKIDAVTFLPKPTNNDSYQTDQFFRDIIVNIKSIVNHEEMPSDIDKLSSRIIAIGASTGGAEAIEKVLTDLPAIMPPILIAQHMPPKFTKTFADRLNNISRLSIKEAENGDILLPGMVYIAPGGYHTSVKKRDRKVYIRCTENVLGNKLCPCIDTLFNSVSIASEGNSIGVLLTGMGSDGAIGLKQMRETGSKTISQDEKSSVIYGMPKAAFEMGAVDYQLPLNQISKKMIVLSQ